MQASAQKNSQTNDIPRITFDSSRFQNHSDQYLATNNFSAPAEDGSYSKFFANNAAPKSLMEGSNPILPPAKLPQQLTTCCTYQVPSTLSMLCLEWPLVVSIPLPQQPLAYFLHSIFLIRRPKLALRIRHSEHRNRPLHFKQLIWCHRLLTQCLLVLRNQFKNFRQQNLMDIL